MDFEHGDGESGTAGQWRLGELGAGEQRRRRGRLRQREVGGGVRCLT